MYEEYKSMPNAEVPEEIAPTLQDGGGIHWTPFEDRQAIFTDARLWSETGYVKMENGDWQVSMYCPMPGVSADMIQWWFWWHPREDARYQLWFPGEHFSIRTAKKDRDYFFRDSMPPFRPNTQYPTEKIGGMRMPLRIDFVTPEEFGIPEDLQRETRTAAVVCGHVGALGGLFYHTEMLHIWFEWEDGLFMISRFWIGRLMKNRPLRKAILTENTARGMARHCCVEYRNLAGRLPKLYAEYGPDASARL